MPQIKIYGLNSALENRKSQISDAIHQSVVEALEFPIEKRFHRFFALEKDDFLFPADKSDHYLIVEIAMMSGRSVTAKKRLIGLLFESLKTEVGIENGDLEICILESPPENWGFRGQTGDEIALGYKIEV